VRPAAVGGRSVPRRRKPSLAARLRPFWIVAAFVLALAVWGGYALANAAWFALAHLGIDVPIDGPVTVAQVRAAAAIPPKANVWLLHAGAIARRIEAIPYVDRASVHRGQFPKPFVEIGVTVRRPSACVSAAGRSVTIDAAARVLQNGCALRSVAQIEAGPAPLPAPGATIVDRDIGRLLDDAKILAGANLGLRALRRDRWGELEAVDRTGMTIRFGDDVDLAKKAALVAPVRAGMGTKRRIVAIDLRAPSTPTVEYR
jgi:hypothetical protein